MSLSKQGCTTPVVPLVVDLDGTLLKTDMLAETLLEVARSRPWSIPECLLEFRAGIAHGKRFLASRVSVYPALLPFEDAALDAIRSAKAAGRPVILATATDQIVAQQIAGHVGAIDTVLASDGHTNLSAERKRRVLVDLYGERGFDYIGNSLDDIPVIASSDKAFLVRPSKRVQAAAQSANRETATLIHPDVTLRDWWRALRVHQWAKNALLLLPMLAAHSVTPQLMLQLFIAFLTFSFMASSVYLLNDLLDLPHDRRHAEKRNRPLAAGRLPLAHAAAAMVMLLATSITLATTLLPPAFVLTLSAYYAATLAYSFALKRLPILDVLALALLYTLRIVAGAAAVSIPLTAWMLAFSLFTFLSLALVKRYSELSELIADTPNQSPSGRGYQANDLSLLQNLGTAAGYLSALVLALYIQDEATTMLYGRPNVIWIAIPVWLYWITRVWMLTHRGCMHQDPVTFAISDRTSYFTAGLLAIVFLIAR